MLVGSGVKGRGGALLAYSSDSAEADAEDAPGAWQGSSAGHNDSASSDASSSTLAAGWTYGGQLCSVADLAGAHAELASMSADLAGSSSAGSSRSIGGGRGSQATASAAHELGEVWECPLLAQLPLGPASSGEGADEGSGGWRPQGSGSGGSGRPWLLAVSPYPAKPPHTPSNPVLYWIGQLKKEGTR